MNCRRAVIFILFFAVVSTGAAATPGDSYKPLNVSEASGSPVLSDIPTYFRIVDGSDATTGPGNITVDHAKHTIDGKEDITVTYTNGTVVPYYWTTFNTTSNTYEGWLRASSLQRNGSTQLRIYIGGGTSDNSTTEENVWDAVPNIWMRHGLNDESPPFNDSTSNNRDSTSVTGTTQVEGEFLTARQFDDSDDVYTYPDSSINDPTQNWSTTVWINPGESGDEDYNTVWHPRSERDLQLVISGGSGDLAGVTQGNIALINYDGSSTNILDTGVTTAMGQWYHVTVVRDPTVPEFRIYVNGELEASGDLPDSATTTGSNEVGQQTATGRGFGGDIDELELFADQLDAATIEAAYNMSDTGGQTLLVQEETVRVEAPMVESIECEVSSTWQSCTSVGFNDVITRLRANVTDPQNDVASVSYDMFDSEGVHRINAGNYTTRSGDSYIYDNTDLSVNESGGWNVTAKATDAAGNTHTNTKSWTVDWGALSVTLDKPASDTTVTQNSTFNGTATVTCSGGECGTVELWADPVWRNQNQNTTTILSGESIELTAESQDDNGLEKAWLATNETGLWKNYSYPFRGRIGIQQFNRSSYNINVYGRSAVRINDTTYVAHAGVDNDAYVTSYNHTGQTWGETYKAGDTSLGSDAHGPPSFGLGPNGYFHLWFGSHSSPIEYTTSTNKYDISSWSNPESWGSDVTYLQMFEYNGSLYNIYRYNQRDPTRWGYRKSTDGGSTWTDASMLLEGAANRKDTYARVPQTVYTANDVISSDHILFAYNKENVDVYVAYLNMTDMHMYNMSGHDLGMNVTPTESDTSTLVKETEGSPGGPDGESVETVRTAYKHGTDYYTMFYNNWSNTSTARVQFGYWNTTTDSWDIRTTPAKVSNKAGKVESDFIPEENGRIELYVPEGSTALDGGGTVLKRYVSTDYGRSWTSEVLANTSDFTNYDSFDDVTTIQNPSSQIEVLFTAYVNEAGGNTPGDEDLFAYGDMYGSPIDTQNTTAWTETVFDWRNPFLSKGTTVGWKIWYQGSLNSTDTQTFSISATESAKGGVVGDCSNGATPFCINHFTYSQPKSQSITDGESFTASWMVNATGSPGSYSFLGLANSTVGSVETTYSDNVTVDIVQSDDSAPSITIHNPPNSTIGDSSPDLNVTANEAVDFWQKSVDGGPNETFQPNTTLSSLSNGPHNVTVWANDSSGNWGKQDQWFTVDTTDPTISYNPSTTNAGTIDRDWILINVSASDNLELGTVTEQFDGTNASFVNSAGGNYWTNHTGLADGTYTVQGFAADNAGNTNSTGGREITVDTSGSDSGSGSDSDPAYFDVNITETNSPVTEGDILNVTADITNTGDESATQTVVLEIDGTQVDSTSGSLSGGQSTSITFTYVTSDGDAGDRTATVASDDDTDSTTISIEAVDDGSTGDTDGETNTGSGSSPSSSDDDENQQNVTVSSALEKVVVGTTVTGSVLAENPNNINVTLQITSAMDASCDYIQLVDEDEWGAAEYKLSPNGSRSIRYEIDLTGISTDTLQPGETVTCEYDVNIPEAEDTEFAVTAEIRSPGLLSRLPISGLAGRIGVSSGTVIGGLAVILALLLTVWWFRSASPRNSW